MQRVIPCRNFKRAARNRQTAVRMQRVVLRVNPEAAVSDRELSARLDSLRADRVAVLIF